MGSMEIRHLQTFITIARLEGFTKAAEHLGYAQSTITAHIQILEEEIGKPLFDRLGKRVILTHTGKQLVPYAKQMLDIYKEIQVLAYDENEVVGDLVIGVSESLTIYRLGESLKNYKKLYPKVNLILKSAKCSELRNQLYQGEIDLMMTIEPEIDETDLVVKNLEDEEMVLVASPEIDLEHLAEDFEQGIILSEEGCKTRIAFEQYLKKKDIKYANPIELSSIEGIKSCVINKLGISVVPYYTVEKEIGLGQLNYMTLKDSFPQFKIQLTYHKHKSLSQAMSKLIEIVEMEYNDNHK